MTNASIGRCAAALLALAASSGTLPPSAASADGEASYRHPVDGYAVYLTVVPSELILGALAPEAARDARHVIVSIFDSRSGQRLGNMDVTARVAAPGFAGEKRGLAPIRIDDAVVYGSGFPMPGRGPFRIDIEFRAHYAPHGGRTTFYFTPPSFAAPQPGGGR